MNYCEDIMPTLLNIATTFLRDATRFESETVICVQYKENESLVFFFAISTAPPRTKFGCHSELAKMDHFQKRMGDDRRLHVHIRL